LITLYQSQVSLVDQGSGLKCVVRPLPAKVRRRDAPQLVIYEGYELGKDKLIPLFPLVQEAGHVTISIHNGAPAALRL
jgi:hypothetical protein